MKFFLDSANIAEISELADYGIIDGITTNPTILAQTNQAVIPLIKQICNLLPSGDVSVEVAATDYDGMIREGSILNDIAENIVIKLPITWHGLKACRYFTAQHKKTNVTLCFSPMQALAAAKAGATYISPFIGRIDDSGHSGVDLIKDIITIYQHYPTISTKILAASIRHVQHLREVALLGVDVATLPFKVVKNLINHPMTDIGLAQFTNDWQNSGLTITK